MKEEIRETIRARRDNLPEEEILKRSAIIKEKLFNLESFEKASTVMFYVSFRTEVATLEMIENAFDEVIVLVPYVDDDGIKAAKITSLEQLEHGAFDILEPKDEFRMEVDPKEIDLVIVPGLVFGLDKHRIGYGEGYYDKFLRKTNAVKVGLAFDLQILDELPNGDHDVPMDIIVTDERVLQ